MDKYVDSIVVFLNIADSTLPEIVIGKNEGLTIMMNAFNTAKKNVDIAYTGKGYLRQISKEADEYTGLQEVFFDGEWRNFAMNSWRPMQARYANVENRSITLANFSFLSFVTSGYISNNYVRFPLAQKPDSLYTFQLEKYVSYDDAEVAVIICAPKPGYKKGIFSGRFYIDTNTFQVLKTEGVILNLQVNLSGPLKMRNIEISSIAQYKKRGDRESVLDFADIEFSAKASFGFITARKISYSSKLLMLDYDVNVKSEGLVAINAGSNDLAAYHVTPYDPKFWEENPIVKRTAEEENIIQKFEKEKKISNFIP
ncbi:MAG: hypothetical protein KF862_20670 [Chitinophagaceae bacterium]|nr:hypothetical protein [Chitinophagaceae bacterium]